ncbi:MOSC N-terminal beta barrel domain-containing protein [Streptomyces buecherae]|uniref:MOSC N-terminal beta barrel domain-containing protein n=1 Tax=Streptomyces buecherae TaxID=2763006 RepID=A0A7H8N6J2_9ACTN|nr:MOSC N-terminal beta barrel domain-containing protein [Streptomyces buecherae]QKW49979.1 MOSC N-terminal beta barrel domain-containing protein [Streptomyces buecherae]
MLGTVRTLRRYPVKSMLGEEVAAADVTRRGLRHDRRIALVHRETGKIASAKNPRLWRDLLTLAATVGDAGEAGGAGAGEPPVRIALPDGRTLLATDEKTDAILSELLGAPVRVAHTPPPGATHHRVEPHPGMGPQPCAGVSARVVRPGHVRQGDPVRLGEAESTEGDLN